MPAVPGTFSDPVLPDPVAAVEEHLRCVAPALESLRRQSPVLAVWGRELAGRLLAGNRLLAAGNGGSAAEAQHLTAELVGRFDGERAPFSAISLHADTSPSRPSRTTTALRSFTHARCGRTAAPATS